MAPSGDKQPAEDIEVLTLPLHYADTLDLQASRLAKQHQKSSAAKVGECLQRLIGLLHLHGRGSRKQGGRGKASDASSPKSAQFPRRKRLDDGERVPSTLEVYGCCGC